MWNESVKLNGSFHYAKFERANLLSLTLNIYIKNNNKKVFVVDEDTLVHRLALLFM